MTPPARAGEEAEGEGEEREPEETEEAAQWEEQAELGARRVAPMPPVAVVATAEDHMAEAAEAAEAATPAVRETAQSEDITLLLQTATAVPMKRWRLDRAVAVAAAAPLGLTMLQPEEEGERVILAEEKFL